MTKKQDLLVYLEDIAESAEIIGDYLSGFSEGEFYKSGEKQDAVVRRIQIIGEAAKHIPEHYRKNGIPYHGKILPECVIYSFMSISE